MSSTNHPGELKRTPLHGLHVRLGAKMTPFAGYDMPVQYPTGVLKEHLHTRAQAGLFDVSHMGQAWLTARDVDLGAAGAHEAAAAAIESVTPGEILRLKPGGLRYSALLAPDGGVLDDLMITRPAEAEAAGRLFLVVNAACKDADFADLEARIGDRVSIERAEDRALLALQGPAAAATIEALFPGAGAQGFMTMTRRTWGGADVYLSRCGYTGEDGFEVSLPSEAATAFAERLLEFDAVAPIGLGERDSLRLEAGLSLYGNDLDPTTSPVEGALDFIIGKRRRAEGGFPGAARILKELAEGPARRRVGLRPEGRAPAREGVEIHNADGARIGVVTSGGFGPTCEGPIAMGYVGTSYAAPGCRVGLSVRGKLLPAEVVEPPFVPHRYYRS